MLKHKKYNEREKIASILSKINNLTDNIRDKSKTHKVDKFYNIIENDVLNNYKIDIPNNNKPVHFSNIKPLVICMFQVRFDGLYPFLLFNLQKQKNNTMTFINFPSFDGGLNDKYLINNCITFINNIYPLSILSYKGYYETQFNNIIILECNNSENEKIQVNNIKLDINECIWTTSHEIINIEKVYDYLIDKSVIELFLKNTNFMFLKNEYSKFYEIPMIGYYPIKKSTNIKEYDVYRETLIESVGKCYHFYINIPDKRDEENIIRTAIFPDNKLLYNMNNRLLCNSNRLYIIKKYKQCTMLSVMK